MKNIYRAIILMLLIGCQDPKKESKQFFEFDEIEHYHNDISDKKLVDMLKKNNNSVEEEIFSGIFTGSYPDGLNDKAFAENIKKTYSKSVIDKSRFKEIENIFREKYYGDYSLAACIPYYRDILIFKKNKSVTGISKICFKCYLHQTIGTKKNTEQLGQNGDYKKLQDILK